jgi:hypothetical protein
VELRIEDERISSVKTKTENTGELNQVGEKDRKASETEIMGSEKREYPLKRREGLHKGA